MKPQEIELWARDIVSSVMSGQPVEDSRIEVKSRWIEPEKAAPRLAAHANSSRGDSILWIIGVDEKGRKIAGADPLDSGSWYKSLLKHFDGFAPRLAKDVNIRINEETVVALHFDTHLEAPYVIKNLKGGYPEYTVPWREGTHLRAASRADLLSILVPQRLLSALLDELEFNQVVAEAPKKFDSDAWGGLFRLEEFNLALRDGILSTLPEELKRTIYEAYYFIDRANQYVQGTFNTSLIGSSLSDRRNEAQQMVLATSLRIIEAREALKSYIFG